MSRATAGLAAIACLVLPPLAGAASLQPGALMTTTVGSCTLNFVFDGAGTQTGKVFLGTAAHCVDAVGSTVQDGDGVTFGKVAAIGDYPDAVSEDFALIEVATASVSRVAPEMKGHPTYPTGVAASTEVAVGDLLQISGYGDGFEETQPTREGRVATYGGGDDSVLTMFGPIIFGDSGGPIVHIDTGKALGLNHGYCIGLCDENPLLPYQPVVLTGPTIAGVIAKAGLAGFPITIRAAGASAPVSPTPTPTPTPEATVTPVATATVTPVATATASSEASATPTASATAAATPTVTAQASATPWPTPEVGPSPESAGTPEPTPIGSSVIENERAKAGPVAAPSEQRLTGQVRSRGLRGKSFALRVTARLVGERTCTGGRVSLIVKGRARTLLRRTAPVEPRCKFKTELRLPRRVGTTATVVHVAAAYLQPRGGSRGPWATARVRPACPRRCVAAPRR